MSTKFLAQKPTLFNVNRPRVPSDPTILNKQITRRQLSSLKGGALVRELEALSQADEGAKILFECIITRSDKGKSSRVKSITAHVGETLPEVAKKAKKSKDGNLVFHQVRDGSVCLAAERNKTIRIFTLEQFKEAISHLGEEDSLSIDYRMGHLLQETLSSNLESKASFTEKFLLAHLHEQLKKSGEDRYTARSFMDVLKPYIDKGDLPLKNALLLVPHFFSEDSRSTTARKVQLLNNLITHFVHHPRKLLNQPQSRVFINSEEFLSSPELQLFIKKGSRIAISDLLEYTVQNEGGDKEMLVSELTAEKLVARFTRYILYRSLALRYNPRFDLGISTLVSGLQKYFHNFTPDQIREKLHCCKDLSFDAQSEGGGGSKSKVDFAQVWPTLFFDALVAKRREPLTPEFLARAFAALDFLPRGDPVLMELCQRFVQTQPDENFQALSSGLNESFVSGQINVSLAKSMIRVIYNLEERNVDQVILAIKCFMALPETDCRTYSFGLTRILRVLKDEDYSRVISQIQEAGFSPKQIEKFIRYGLFFYADDTNFTEAMGRISWPEEPTRAVRMEFVSSMMSLNEYLRTFQPQSLTELVFLSLFNKYTEKKISMEGGLSLKAFEKTDWNLFMQLSPDLLEVWSPFFMRNFKVNQDFCTYIPSIPIEDAPQTNLSEFRAFIHPKGYAQLVNEGIIAIWDKEVMPHEEALKEEALAHFSKLIELNVSEQVSDKLLKTFFTNIHDQAEMCWPGLLMKIRENYRDATLHLAAAAGGVNPILRPPQEKEKLMRIIEVATGVEANSEEYERYESRLQNYTKEIAFGASQLLKAKDAHEINYSLDKFVASVNEKEAKEIFTPDQIEEGASLYFEGNKWCYKVFATLCVLEDEKLSETQILELLGLPPHNKMMLERVFLKPLFSKGWIKKEGTNYVLNTDLEEVQEAGKKLIEEKVAKGGSKEDKQIPIGALFYALKLACPETPEMQHANALLERHQLKISLIAKGNKFTKGWLNANANVLKLALVEHYIKPANMDIIKQGFSISEDIDTGEVIRVDLSKDEDKVNYIYRNRGNLARNPAQTGRIETILKAGNEVHFTTAAEQVFSNELGTNPSAAENDRYAMASLNSVQTSGFGANVALWRYNPSAEQKQVLLENLAMQLNETAETPEENIDSFSTIQAEIVNFLKRLTDFQKIEESLGYLPESDTLNERYKEVTELMENLLSLSFTQTEEGKPRITPQGVNYLLGAFNLIDKVA